MFGLPNIIGVIISLVIGFGAIALIIISIKWIINSFKAFKALEEIKRDTQFIYNLLKDEIKDKQK